MEYSEYYSWVLVLEVLLGFECLLINFIALWWARSKVFTKEYINQHYFEVYQNQLGRAPEKEGYPDMGNGRLSENLSFSQWYLFNNAQRAAYNFIEQAYFPLICLPIAGLYYDIAAICLGSAYIVGRLFYTIGYIRGGPSKRAIGAVLFELSMLGLFIVALMSAFAMQYD